jgi:kelch-like protein 10
MDLDPERDNLQIISKGTKNCESPPPSVELNDLRQKNLFCDAVLRLEDGGTFQVHRVVLSAHSGYFRTIFTTKLRSNDNTDVFLPGVASQTMKLILDYVYTRNVDINQENVCQLLEAADYLIFPGLLELCCDFLRDVLTLENCIGILRFVSAHFCSNFEGEARRFIMRNFVQISRESEEFLELSPKELQTMIGSDELNVETEEVVWEGVRRWIDHDTENRKGHIPELLKRVRMALLDQIFLLGVMFDSYVLCNSECLPIIEDVCKFLRDSQSITQKEGETPVPDFARSRIPHILFAIGGWREAGPTNIIETYDRRADRWVEVEEVDPIGPRAFHRTAVIGFNIYVIGGFNGQDYLNSCRCFNAAEKSWRELSPMKMARCYLSAVVLNEMVYAMGGYDGLRRQKTAERYDYRKNYWSLIAPMNVQRSDASAAAFNGKIYIAGGYNGQECMNSAEVYDPEINQWTYIPAMNFRRSGLSCIAYHDHVYAVGGSNGVAHMSNGEKYNPRTGTWTQIPDMNAPRSKFGIELIDDKIFAIGGFHCASIVHEVEYYDEECNKWFQASNMNTYRTALSACVVTDLPNIRDYIQKNRDRVKENRFGGMKRGIDIKVE